MDAVANADRWAGNASEALALESPFAEGPPAVRREQPMMADMRGEGLTPFADSEDPGGLAEADAFLRETLADLHDEDFHDAVAFLAEETEAAVEDRFQQEDAAGAGERERFARTYLSPVQFEADQYLASLQAGLAEVDPATLSAEALDEHLDRYDPGSGDLSPASEEFIGGLIKKAKGVVRKVAKVAKAAGKLAAPLLTPMLNKLRGLVRPLLERVLKFAIGKLPVPLQPAARTLADRILGKAMATPASTAPAQAPAPAPTQATDTMALADSFDLSLAEAVAFPNSLEAQPDQFSPDYLDEAPASDELPALAQARAELIERLGSSESADELEPHIEQFVPVLLAALRTGIGIVGRPKVVSFLAGYLAKMIKQWVDQQASGPLSKAIVDAGLKMVSLEAESGDGVAPERIAPVALASVVEDTVRRLAEADSYLFEDNDLAEVTIADAFGEAAATFLPQETLREELQLAPSLGGRFVTRRPGRLRSYAKYSRVPEVAISARAADVLPAFGGTSLGAAVRAAGGRFPVRARMHIFHAKPGSSVASMVRHGMRHAPRTLGAFPLTPQAAAVLLREPGLGANRPDHFLKSKRRIAAGQRLYVLEPLDQTVMAIQGKAPAPGRAWVAVNAAKAQITLGFYLSESDAQLVAGALRNGRGHGELLRRILEGYRDLAKKDSGTGGLTHEDGEDLASFAERAGARLPQGFLPALRHRIAAWALPALSTWLRSNSETFLKAAAHPDPGVRLRIRLMDVPGLDKITGKGPAPGLAALDAALKGKPKIAILVTPGNHRK